VESTLGFEPRTCCLRSRSARALWRKRGIARICRSVRRSSIRGLACFEALATETFIWPLSMAAISLHRERDNRDRESRAFRRSGLPCGFSSDPSSRQPSSSVIGRGIDCRTPTPAVAMGDRFLQHPVDLGSGDPQVTLRSRPRRRPAIPGQALAPKRPVAPTGDWAARVPR
jgi:hypothetical protein